MLIDSLLNRGSMPVLERVMSFTEARQQVLANNVSNLDTVGYKMQDLPEAEFSAALREAVDRRDSAGTSAELMLRNTRHLQWDQNGRLHAEPAEIEDSNILFHDENNRSVEKQMTEMAKNGLRHTLAVEMLRGQYQSLRSAIRGQL